MAKKNNQVTCFMYYMSNKWGEKESKELFGELGKHIYDKWLYYRDRYLDDLFWYSQLDAECREKVVQRAVEIYG